MQTIKLNQISSHPLQPPARSQDTTELQESHRQVGILRPPIVVPDGDNGYRCLAGWRTITAARAMGLTEMLCVVREDLVDDLDKQFAIFVQSNIHQELTMLEKADIIKAAVGEGQNLRCVAGQMAISTTEANHLLNLASAPDEVKELVRRGSRGGDGLSYTTFKAELSALSGERMIERLQEAGDLSRKALKRARQKAIGTPDRILEDTDYILRVIHCIRLDLAKVVTFLKTATPEAKDEVRVAILPVVELAIDIVKEVQDGGA